MGKSKMTLRVGPKLVMGANRGADEFEKELKKKLELAIHRNAVLNVDALRRNIQKGMQEIFSAAVHMTTEKIIGKISSNYRDAATSGSTQGSRIVPMDGTQTTTFQIRDKTFDDRNPVGKVESIMRATGKRGVFVAGKVAPRSVSVTWRGLSEGYLTRKAKRVGGMASARKFFRDSGSLRTAIAQSPFQQAKFYRLQVRDERGRFTKENTISIARVNLTMLPGLPARDSILSGRYDERLPLEQHLFPGLMSGGFRSKLLGPEHRHRPLLQPVFAYYLLNHAPRVYLNALLKSKVHLS